MAAHKEAWGHFKTLHKLWEDTRASLFRPGKTWTAYNLNAKLGENVVSSDLPMPLKRAVWELANYAINYPDYCLEISKRNCAVDYTGRLILFDPLFNLEEV